MIDFPVFYPGMTLDYSHFNPAPPLLMCMAVTGAGERAVKARAAAAARAQSASPLTAPPTPAQPYGPHMNSPACLHLFRWAESDKFDRDHVLYPQQSREFEQIYGKNKKRLAFEPQS